MNRQQLESKAIAATQQLLRAKGIVSMVDVLMILGKLSKADYERWRLRQVPYLEKVMPGNLNQFQFLLRVVRAHAHWAKLKPSLTVYTSWGKGPRQRLRFSKTGNPHIEEQYSTHFVSSELKKAKLTSGGPTLNEEHKLPETSRSNPRPKVDADEGDPF